jgi:Tfp pilus assembly protein PilW
MRKIHNASGSTLIEFLMYIAIISIILIAATDVLFVVLDGKAKIQAIESVGQNGRIALQKMEQTIRNAQSVTTPASSATGTSLTLQTSSTSTSPTSFFLFDGVLFMKEGTSASTSLMADEATVNNLLFQNVGGTSTPAVIRIRMSVSSTNPALDPANEYGETFYGSAAVRRRL